MFKVKYHIVGLITACMMLTACGGGGSAVESVDLDKVLDVVTATLDELDAGSTYAPSDTLEPAVDSSVADEKMAIFLVLCTEKMNDAKLISQPVGLAFLDDGAFEGFVDPNNSGTKDSGENQIFKVEIDAERNRLIASDTQNHRESGFSATGLLAGLLIGSMLGRQRAAGVDTNRFKNQKMSPKNSTGGGTSKASASARSKSSSGSYSSGK